MPAANLQMSVVAAPHVFLPTRGGQRRVTRDSSGHDENLLSVRIFGFVSGLIARHVDDAALGIDTVNVTRTAGNRTRGRELRGRSGRCTGSWTGGRGRSSGRRRAAAARCACGAILGNVPLHRRRSRRDWPPGSDDVGSFGRCRRGGCRRRRGIDSLTDVTRGRIQHPKCRHRGFLGCPATSENDPAHKEKSRCRCHARIWYRFLRTTTSKMWRTVGAFASQLCKSPSPKPGRVQLSRLR